MMTSPMVPSIPLLQSLDKKVIFYYQSNIFIEKIPLLYIDINLGKEKGMQRVILYDDD